MTDKTLLSSIGPARIWLALAVALVVGLVSPGTSAQAVRGGDHILVIVNQEVVTASELAQRMALLRQSAARSGASLPAEDEFRREVLDGLIDERVQVTHARDAGQRVEEVELDRAVANVAQQNQITPAQLRDQVRWGSPL